MNKYQRIDEFLKFFSDIAKENPELEINKDLIYRELTRLGLPKEEKSKRINNIFPKWINHFENVPNCKVFVDPRWKYFCQFVSDESLLKAKDHIKIYIPLDSEHIEKGAEFIFGYLSLNNISHLSKIGSDIRFDDIVIRLSKPEDAEKLISFIKNNQYIQEGLLPANPFVYNNGGIAMVSDGKLSFNSTLANLIALYINECKKNGKLNDVSITDFYTYLNNYYTSRFQDLNGLERLAQDFNASLNSDSIVNYQNVIIMMINAVNLNYSYDDYLNHYKACTDSDLNQKRIEKFNSIIITGQQNRNNNNKKKEEEVLSLLQELYEVMVRKYGREIAKNNIKLYINANEIGRITRDNNLRSRIYSSNFRFDILTILNHNNLTLEDLLNRVEIQSLSSDKEKVLKKAIIETYNKKNQEFIESKSVYSGEEYIKLALKEFVLYNNYDVFTRTNNAREELKAFLTNTEALDIIKKSLEIAPNITLNEQELFNILNEYITNVLVDKQIMKR